MTGPKFGCVMPFFLVTFWSVFRGKSWIILDFGGIEFKLEGGSYF